MRTVKNQNGFTLAEILVAMGLMVIVAFCFTPFMLSSLKNVQMSGEKREELYQEQGKLEEKYADHVNDGDSNVPITFRQDGKSDVETGVAGTYLESTEKLFSAFSAKDEATLTISPGSVSENCPIGTAIKISSDFLTFDDMSQFDFTENGTSIKNRCVTFEPVDGAPNQAIMKLVFNDRSIVLSAANTYLIKYGELSARLRITPPSLITVGAGGSNYGRTSSGSWKARSALGSYTLRDAVWTGTQYVAAGDKGSWYYTEEDGGWKTLETPLIGRSTWLFYEVSDYQTNELYLDSDGKLYMAGKYTESGLFTTNSYGVFNTPDPLSEITLSQNYDDQTGTAAVRGWVNGAMRVLWGYTYARRPYVNENQIGTENALVSGMSWNGQQSNEKSEIVLSLGNGKIYNLTAGNGWNWVNNGDRTSDIANRILREDKLPRYYVSYMLKNGDTLEIDVEKGSESAGLLPVTRTKKSGRTTYTVQYNGQTYTLATENGGCEIRDETYYQDSTVTTEGTLNDTAYGDTGVWVAVGNAALNSQNVYTKDVISRAYRIGSWTNNVGKLVPGTTTTGSNVTDETAVTSSQAAKILWRDANAANPGQWHPATVPSGVGTLNAVEYIGGRFYAVGDSGTILSSDDGKEWKAETLVLPSGVTTKPNLYGIAGWGLE